MTEKKPDASEDVKNNQQDLTPTCGIVMPIASMGDEYPEEHWRRVRKILQKSIGRAGMKAQLVWDNPEVDVIQSAILQNLYENDVVICDVSGLNPNVMLETGLRLSTKRPTIIVTDRRMKPPFDISTIGYIEYRHDLEYNAIEDFIVKLQSKIETVFKSQISGTYKSFVEQFTFETVTPSTVSVPAEEFIRDQINSLISSVRRIEENQRQPFNARQDNPEIPQRRYTFIIRATVDSSESADLEASLDGLTGFGISEVSIDDEGRWTFRISTSPQSRHNRESAEEAISQVLNELNIRSYSMQVRQFKPSAG